MIEIATVVFSNIFCAVAVVASLKTDINWIKDTIKGHAKRLHFIEINMERRKTHECE